MASSVRNTPALRSIPVGLLILVMGLSSGLARATQIGPVTEVCDQAARIAARETGVPVDLLRAVTRTETGRRRNGQIQPWPWTVNIEGTGAWFDTRAQALSFVLARQEEGARSFDIGCFQINHRWHGNAFASVDAMFDPLENARYAASFLRDLHAEFGSWDGAVGAFHSRRPGPASRYLASYQNHLAALPPADARLMPAPELLNREDASRAAAPLLPMGRESTRNRGSLVPLSDGGARALFEGA